VDIYLDGEWIKKKKEARDYLCPGVHGFILASVVGTVFVSLFIFF